MNRRPDLEVALAFALTSLGGCASETDSRTPIEPALEQDQAEARDPASGLEDLEQRLLAAERVAFDFVIESEGAVVSHLEGSLSWQRDGELVLIATGDFAGQPQELELRADATTLSTYVAGQPRASGPRPPALVEAVVLGLTHMGLLHNLALLTGGMGPDHAEGGAREWLDVDDLEATPPERRGEVEAGALEFVVVVGDAAVGRAKLWIDGQGRPLERSQSVDFPQGEMRVIERYSNVVITP